MVIAKTLAKGNVTYTLIQCGADKFAMLVRDEDADRLINRTTGGEETMRRRYESAVEYLRKTGELEEVKE